MPSPSFIAVDWGTTRLRASLIGEDGSILDRTASDMGVQSVPKGGFPAALDAACGAWLDAHTDRPVVMAGMVGSRNGWVEAPYVAPPCDGHDLARALLPVQHDGRTVLIVPGVDCRAPDGTYDVMRGEETQAVGTGVSDGLVCLPGTHSKWVEFAGGRMQRFVTFATGELYAALIGSFVGRLAEEPADGELGRAIAAKVAAVAGGLSRLMFQARTQVLAGQMSGHAVRPFLSALLIDTEVREACALFGTGRPVTLVAAEPQRSPYLEAMGRHGIETTVVEPETATTAGLVRIAALRGLLASTTT